MDDLDDLLAGGEALEDLGADRPLADAGDEVLDDLEVDVGLEQGEADLAHRGIDVGLGDRGRGRSGRRASAQSLAEGVEHGPGGTPCRWSGSDGRPDVAARDPLRVVRGF